MQSSSGLEIPVVASGAQDWEERRQEYRKDIEKALEGSSKESLAHGMRWVLLAQGQGQHNSRFVPIVPITAPQPLPGANHSPSLGNFWSEFKTKSPL